METDVAKYIVYCEKMNSYGFGNNGQVITKHISDATKYNTFGDAMKVAIKYMEFYEDSKFIVKSYFDKSPQKELIGLFLNKDKVECIAVTPYQNIIDRLINENDEISKGCEFFVKKVPYYVD